MDTETFNAIHNFLGQRPYPLFSELCVQFKEIENLTLRSIYASTRQRQFKNSKFVELKSPIKAQSYWEWYQDELKKHPMSGFLLTFARKLDLPPSLLVRSLVQSQLSLERENKHTVSDVIRNPNLIADLTLAKEISLATLSDDVFGPFPDAIKLCSGLEHEALLKKNLREAGIPFIDEEQLRTQGFDKTPDVKLVPPAALLSEPPRIINWIESKATFGDAEGHDQYLADQYSTYVNRYGPGLVIYWFGFLDKLRERDVARGVTVAQSFPSNIKPMKFFYT